ncbi:MAG TPA: hypothetical protein VFP36_03200 [Usitatibacter sp.]|nr:hypothetical protein [Usitatibacter sp.]
MAAFARVTAFVLIATLTINLGDWPFIDELLSDLQEQGILFVAVAQQADSVATPDRPATDADMGVTYEALSIFTNVSPPPENGFRLAIAQSIGRLTWSDAKPVEYILAAPFRPPAA